MKIYTSAASDLCYTYVYTCTYKQYVLVVDREQCETNLIQNTMNGGK